MTIASDADLFPTRFIELVLVPATAAHGYGHMGAVLVDTALQPNSNYVGVLKPRVQSLILTWPDATMTAVFARRMASEDISEYFRGMDQINYKCFAT